MFWRVFKRCLDPNLTLPLPYHTSTLTLPLLYLYSLYSTSVCIPSIPTVGVS